MATLALSSTLFQRTGLVEGAATIWAFVACERRSGCGFTPTRGTSDMKIGSIQSLACVGLGAVLGFVAATRDVTPSSRAGVAAPAARQAAAEAGATGLAPTSPPAVRRGRQERCCWRRPGRTPKTNDAPKSSGKKPNIVFIMGDDIGWFNIGAYHRGMMAGKTPNLDKLASAGHDLHRLLRRGELHGGPGQLHHRPVPDPHRDDDGRPGGCHDRAAGPGAHHRHGPQVDGLRHRPVRQEPPGRPQRVPADRPRVRRVLRLPLPPRRDGGPVTPQLPARTEGQGRPAQHDPLLGDGAGRPDRTARAGARSASRRSRTPARSTPSGWRRWTTRSSTTR